VRTQNLAKHLYICLMNNELIYSVIRNTVKSHLPDARILLFGSRARGDHDTYGDFDLLIITPETFTPKEKVLWSTRLDKALVKAIKALVKAIKAPVDLLLNSEEEVRQKLGLPGRVIRTIVREGLAL
jgi:predicted nucleotidyltransferase